MKDYQIGDRIVLKIVKNRSNPFSIVSQANTSQAGQDYRQFKKVQVGSDNKDFIELTRVPNLKNPRSIKLE